MKYKMKEKSVYKTSLKPLKALLILKNLFTLNCLKVRESINKSKEINK